MLRLALLLSLSLAVTGCPGSSDPVSGPIEDSAHLVPLATAIENIPVDVKPGECPNYINPRSKGMISIAILGTADFDIHDIDVSSLLLYVQPLFGLGGIAPIHTNLEDVAAPAGGRICECADDGPDGYEDLVLKYRTQDVLAALGQLDTGDELGLIIRGVLLDGTEFGGINCVAGTGSKQDPLYNYEIRIDRGEASQWFGGDNLNGPRNVAAGQSVLITRDIVLESFAFSLDRYFDYSGGPERFGHEVTLVLDVRDVSGQVLKSLPTLVPVSFKRGWIWWDGIDLPVDENTTLILTAYSSSGFSDDLNTGIEADETGGYSDGTGYSAEDRTGTGLADWSEWGEKTWDFHFWAKGHLRKPEKERPEAHSALQ